MTRSDKLRKIKAVVLDVDGVLTDGRAGFGGENEIKFFHLRDGHWMKLAIRAGLKVGLLSGRGAKANRQRAGELGLSFCYENCKDKLSDDVAKEVTDKVNELKEALKGEDIEKIKSAQSELMTSAQKIGQALYAQQGAADAAGAAGAAGSAPADDDVVDAEVVDDDDKDNK